MYPHVTQFETRTMQIRDEIRLQAELEALRRPTQTPRRIALPRRILCKLRMNARIKQLGIALLAAAAFAVPASGAGQPGQLAGPSYTPKELKAFSAMTFAAKQAYLAALAPTTTVPLAGRWYTLEERKALAVYSKASSAEKKAILAGTGGVVDAAQQTSFHWRDATIGGGVTLAFVALLGALSAGAWVTTRRARRTA